MLIRHLFNLNKETQEREVNDEETEGGRERGAGGFMYRYLHGCKVTKSCGMLQVADPRPAPEESSLPGPCTPDLNGLIIKKKGEKRVEWTVSSSLSQERKTGIVQPDSIFFFFFFY